MSQTSFSPESPTSRTTRLLGEAVCAEVRALPKERWPLAARVVAIDCIKWLGGGGVETEKCRRANNGVRFTYLTPEQSDTLNFLYFTVRFDEMTIDAY